MEFCNWTKTDEVAMQRNTYLKSVFCYSLTIGTTNQVLRRMNCHILTLNAVTTKNILFPFSVVSDIVGQSVESALSALSVIFLALSAYLTIFDKTCRFLMCRDKGKSYLIVLQQKC